MPGPGAVEMRTSIPLRPDEASGEWTSKGTILAPSDESSLLDSLSSDSCVTSEFTELIDTFGNTYWTSQDSDR
jgi:hypothetical protein